MSERLLSRSKGGHCQTFLVAFCIYTQVQDWRIRTRGFLAVREFGVPKIQHRRYGFTVHRLRVRLLDTTEVQLEGLRGSGSRFE